MVALAACFAAGCAHEHPPVCGGDFIEPAPPPEPLPAGVMFSLTWGPAAVPAGDHGARCVQVRLNNAEPIKVGAMRIVLPEGATRLIVYRDDADSAEQTAPRPCDPPADTLVKSGMVVAVAIVQRPRETVVLPGEVAYSFAPTQMVRLELEVAPGRTGDDELAASVDFVGVDPASIKYEAKPLTP